jgi:MoaA/NifB/PqqE/SkfB family radical SAM enzyme
MRSAAGYFNDYLTFKQNKPTFKNLAINITGKCNLDCIFCECQSLDGNEDLSFKELESLFKEMSSRGVKSVFIGGGEPFLRKDIFDILISLKEMKYNISMITNGYVVGGFSDKKLEIINDSVDQISLSLDSATPELHNYYRSNKHAFSRAVKAIQSLASLKKTKLLVSSIITKDNYLDIGTIIEYMDSLGVERISFQPFSESTNFPEVPPKNKKGYLITSEQNEILKKVCDEALQKVKDLKITTNLGVGMTFIFKYFENKGKDVPIYNQLTNKFECYVPFNDFYVRHNGDVQLCALLPKISSVREKDVDAVIDDIQKSRIFLLDGKFPLECRKCFCNLSANIKFSNMAHPIKYFKYFKKMLLK